MAASQKNSIDDKYWVEVQSINNYSIFMGYLLMGVRGLGLLVLTWTTVVLLGGFVSMLQKKDFWCLTTITLVQTVGVVDFLLKEKASDIGNSLKGLFYAVLAAIPKPHKEDRKNNGWDECIGRILLALFLFVVQMLVLGIVLCPLVVLYVFGLYLSAGISLWRLIQHDYGNVDGAANFKPAVNVLYSLAVVQGVVYGYKAIYDLKAKNRLVEAVANHYSLETDLVLEYLDETVTGCMKDPLSVRGRNLVTYAVDLLMESKSRYGYISGVLILGRVTLEKKSPHGQSGLMKQLLSGSVSFSHVVQRLVETFGPASPYSTEIKVRAASIVATIAGSIRLDHFPTEGRMMIQCISCLLDTFEEYSRRPEGYDDRGFRYLPEEEYERGWLLDDQEIRYLELDKIPTPMAADNETQGYKGLVVQGLCILQGLAANEDNCRVISKAQGLLYKSISPLISDQLHGGDHHDEWCSMAEESLQLMKRLMATPTPPGETEATKLRNEISGNTQSIIRAVKGILECLRCQVLLKRQAVQVLVDLSVDTHTLASIMLMPGASGRSSTMFLWILLHISLLPDHHFDMMMYGSAHFVNKSSDIKRLAGEKLHAILSSETSTLRSVGDVIRSLATVVEDAENSAGIRVHAATILSHLVRYYTNDDENLKQLKKAMTDVVMPEMLKQIIVHARGRGTRKAGIQVVTEANNESTVLLAEGLDLEQGGVPHDNDNGQESSSTPHQQEGEQHQGILLQQALLELCDTIIDAWIARYFQRHRSQDLTREFNNIAAKICSGQGMPHETFETLVRKAQAMLLREEKRPSRLAAGRTSQFVK